jgi:hypothetical protein
MVSAEECDIGEIIHGSCRILQKIYQRILKDFTPNHFFAKKGSEVSADTGLREDFPTLETIIDKCSNIKDRRPR